MSTNYISETLISCDKWANFLPVASTATNLVNLFLKCVSNCFSNVNKNHYFQYLSKKSFSDCLILLIPGFGNFYYYYHHKQKNKPASPNIEKKNKSSEQEKPIETKITSDNKAKSDNIENKSPKQHEIEDKNESQPQQPVVLDLSEKEVSDKQFSFIDPQVQKNRPFLIGRAYELNGDLTQAIVNYTEAATQQNHPLAMFYLAQCYKNQKNEKESIKWYKEAVKHQHFESLLILIEKAFKLKLMDEAYELCHKVSKCLTMQGPKKQKELLELLEKQNQNRNSSPFTIKFNFLLGQEESSRAVIEENANKQLLYKA